MRDKEVGKEGQPETDHLSAPTIGRGDLGIRGCATKSVGGGGEKMLDGWGHTRKEVNSRWAVHWLPPIPANTRDSARALKVL